jgi:hypothetical protein
VSDNKLSNEEIEVLEIIKQIKDCIKDINF